MDVCGVLNLNAQLVQQKAYFGQSKSWVVRAMNADWLTTVVCIPQV
jgi:hypothetical protein